jgi:hypothetical protein
MTLMVGSGIVAISINASANCYKIAIVAASLPATRPDK